MSRPQAAVLLLLCTLIGLVVFLWQVPDFNSTPHPAKNFEEAIAKFKKIEETERNLPLSNEGHSRLLSHGQKTKRAFVLLHGLTNCPEQFVPFAKILHAAGANVIIPRARYAGLANLMNDVQGLQSGQDLLDQAATGLDIAAGLGDHISLVGLSGTSIAAAWMAQNREGIESVVIISPFFSFHGHAVITIDALGALLARVPNFYRWWNEDKKEANPGPPYAYPRYGTRCMAEAIQLSRNVRSHLTSRPLRVAHLAILTTAIDKGANNTLTNQLASAWMQQNPGRISIFNFPESFEVPHDMIDPHQPNAKTEITYPKILELLGEGSTSPP